MQSLEYYVISRYMIIGKRINKLEQKKRYKRWMFYQQTFHTSVAYTGYEVIVEAIKTDKAIERLDETIRAIEQHIKLLEIKQRYWEKFFNGLSFQDRQYFTQKYIYGHQMINERLDRMALEEIDEIDNAIAFQYCAMTKYEEPRIELTKDDPQANIEAILEFLGA